MRIKINMSGMDRGLRIALSPVLIYLGFFDTHIISNVVVCYLIGSLGLLNLVSAIIGFCPVYKVAHISTFRASN